MTTEADDTARGQNGPHSGIHICEVRSPSGQPIPGAVLVFDGSRGRGRLEAEAEGARARAAGMRAFVWQM